MANPQVHDTVFRDYFNDKTRLLSLCNALLKTDFDNPEDIIINTIEGTYFSGIKNDVSCLLKDYFVTLIEHQTSDNNNMPFRCLTYMATLLQNYVAARDLKRKLFDKPTVKLPRPRCFVLYEGKDRDTVVNVQKLSTAFDDDDTVLELKVIVVNINRLVDIDAEWKGLENCRYLTDYVYFVKLVDEYKKTLTPEQAVQKAIDDCKKSGIMADYFEKREKEIFNMMAFQWNEEEAHQAWFENGKEEGMNEGISIGAERERRDMIKNMKLAGADTAFIAKVSGWSPEQIAAL